MCWVRDALEKTEERHKKITGYEKEGIMTAHAVHWEKSSEGMGIVPSTLLAALLQEWHPSYEHNCPGDAAVFSVVAQLGDDRFRLSTVNDIDPEHCAVDDLTVGEPVWLGDDVQVVNQGSAENWALQSALENEVANCTFEDVARVFVLEQVAARLALITTNGQ